MIQAFAALLLFQFVGEVLARALQVPLPGPLAGMLLLFAALLLRGHVPAPLASTSGLLLQHMMLMFVPPVAGVMLHFNRVAREWQPFLIASVVGTLVTLVVTALTLQWLLGRQPPGDAELQAVAAGAVATAAEAGAGTELQA
ncbi:MAG: CidA/LrgA family protein [Giesbergeria sp.]|nr:CidA/LrgA family protein [Giesbergeria sp.]